MTAIGAAPLAQARRDYAQARGFAAGAADIAAVLLATGLEPARVWGAIADDLRQQATALQPDRALHVALAALAASCVRTAQQTEPGAP